MSKYEPEYKIISPPGAKLSIQLGLKNAPFFDILNKRMITNNAVVRLSLKNVADFTLELKNPILVVCNNEGEVSTIRKYKSSKLEILFPRKLDPEEKIAFNLNANNFKELLKNSEEESFTFQIEYNNSEPFEPIFLEGDIIEEAI